MRGCRPTEANHAQTHLVVHLAPVERCQTSRAPVSKDTTETTVLGSVAWADINGLTQDEIRAKLGIAQTGETLVRSAVLEGDVVVARTHLEFDFGGQPCAPPAPRSSSRVGFSHTSITLVFRDFRLTEVEQDPRVAARQGLDLPLVAKCWVHIRKRKSVKETLNDGYTVPFAVFAVVLVPAIGLAQAQTNSKQSKQTRAFAELRLGEAPPGGLAAWAKLHSDFVKLSRDEAAQSVITAEIKPYSGTDIRAQAFLLDGRVVELRNGSAASCALQTDRSFLCYP